MFIFLFSYIYSICSGFSNPLSPYPMHSLPRSILIKAISFLQICVYIHIFFVLFWDPMSLSWAICATSVLEFSCEGMWAH